MVSFIVHSINTHRLRQEMALVLCRWWGGFVEQVSVSRGWSTSCFLPTSQVGLNICVGFGNRLNLQMDHIAFKRGMGSITAPLRSSSIDYYSATSRHGEHFTSTTSSACTGLLFLYHAYVSTRSEGSERRLPNFGAKMVFWEHI